MAYLLATLAAGSGVWPAVAWGQDATEAAQPEWFVGAYYRHVWVPKAFLKPFLERAASISNDGLGLTLSHHTRGGVTAQLGIGYIPYHFKGAFNARNSRVEDTEYLVSQLALIHLTGSLLWPIELHRTLTLELGLGIDFGVIAGKLRRTEAYSDEQGRFRPCQGALKPAVVGPDTDAVGGRLPYCGEAYDSNGKRVTTTPDDTAGEHYGVRESRIPPVMLLPMLPHIALRFAPLPRVAVQLEAAFGLAQLWIGAAVQVGLGARRVAPAPSVAPPPPPLATLEPKPGRVLGKLMEQGTRIPIPRASVKSKRMFSAIQTDAEGLFVFENLAPGELRLEITHPEYAHGSCTARIPAQGGDTFLHCFLQPQHKEGAISGLVKDEQGRPVARARVEITGAKATSLQSDADGLFALPDAPEGTYRLRVAVAGYLTQLVEIEVRARETAMPQIILLKAEAKP